MEDLQKYFRENPISFDEFSAALKKLSPNKVFILLGPSKPLYDYATSKDDIQEELVVGSALFYDAKEQTQKSYYLKQIKYNADDLTISTVPGISLLSEVPMTLFLENVRFYSQDRVWLPDNVILSDILSTRFKSKISMTLVDLLSLNYPNETAVKEYIISKQ